MNIGFDLDGILVSLPPFLPPWIIAKLYRVKVDGKLMDRMPGALEQRIRQLSHIYLFRPPMRGNIAFVRKLSENKKNNLFLISSRLGFLKRTTERIVKRYDIAPLFHSLFFNFANDQAHFFKDKLIKKYKIERYVDDDMQLLRFLAKHNPKTKFFWLNHKDNEKLLDNLFAITNLTYMLK